jgi:hypothetical protein
MNKSSAIKSFHFLYIFVASDAFSLAKGLLFLQLTPSMSIFDTMQSLQSPVGTHCVGYAYNLAAFLLAAGEKVIIFSTRVWNGSVNAGELDLLYSDFD